MRLKSDETSSAMGGSLGIDAFPQFGEGDGLAGHGFVPALAEAFFGAFEGDAFAKEPYDLQQVGQVLGGCLLNLLHYGVEHNVVGSHGFACGHGAWANDCL